SLSYFGPPTAPISTASAALASARVASGSGCIATSKPAPPIGAVSISMANPALRSASRTLMASATISGPMPSPGRMATFTGSHEPGLGGETLCFERADLVGVRQREADVVEPVQQAMLAEWLHLEAEDHRSVRRGDGLLIEIDRQAEARECGGVGEQPVDFMHRKLYRQQPVLEAVVVEDIAERWRDQRAKSIIEQCPRSVLARAAAAKITTGEQDRGTAITRIVEDEVRVLRPSRVVLSRLAEIKVAPRVEQVRTEARTLDRLQELLGNDGVGVDVGTSSGATIPVR